MFEENFDKLDDIHNFFKDKDMHHKSSQKNNTKGQLLEVNEILNGNESCQKFQDSQ